MKNKAVILLIAFAAFMGINGAHGALPIKNTPAACAPSQKQADTTQTKNEHLLSSISEVQSPDDKNHKHNHPPIGGDNRPGWPGILALVFGIFSFYGGFIPALIFGIKGVNPKYKNRGLALAGLIICALEVILLLAIMLSFSGVF